MPHRYYHLTYSNLSSWFNQSGFQEDFYPKKHLQLISRVWCKFTMCILFLGANWRIVKKLNEWFSQNWMKDLTYLAFFGWISVSGTYQPLCPNVAFWWPSFADYDDSEHFVLGIDWIAKKCQIKPHYKKSFTQWICYSLPIYC